ncbi:MAG TPA: hypothetical protein DCO77_02990 [Nitrospiraceae bacterium]|nr:hypothetical protein [Nitrospiraceae bacterium]
MFELERNAVTGVESDAGKRPIGEMLLEGELIIPHDLEFALEQQKYSKEPLGEILVRMGALNQSDLDAVLAQQGTLFTFSS